MALRPESGGFYLSLFVALNKGFAHTTPASTPTSRVEANRVIYTLGALCKFSPGTSEKKLLLRLRVPLPGARINASFEEGRGLRFQRHQPVL